MELDFTEAKTRTLDMTRSAAMRDPRLRHNAANWWTWQQKEAEWGRQDERLEDEAEKVGMGIREGDGEAGPGVLLARTRKVVNELLKMAWGWEDPGDSVGRNSAPDASQRARTQSPSTQPT